MGFQVRFNCCELSWSVVSGEGPVAIFSCQTSIKKISWFLFLPRLWSAETRLSRSRFCSGLDLRFEQRFKQHCDKLDFQLVFTSTHVLVVEENSQYVSFTFSSVVNFVSMSAGKQAKRDLEHKKGRYFRERGRFAQKGVSLKLATRAFPIFENVKKDSHKRVLTQIVYPCLPQAPHQPPEHCFYLFPSVFHAR